ncbi:MAG: PQQ-binding-like beta-propeller repeat protein [Dehalococcoidia bacterium]
MPAKVAKVEPLFKSPGPKPNGLHAAPDGLWYIDQGNDKLYKLDWKTGKPLFEAQTTTDRSSGITIGGGYIWIASTYNSKICKLDMETGKTVQEYSSPGAGINAAREHLDEKKVTGDHGLEWKDGRLYVASPPSQYVHVMDPETWAEVHRFKVPGFRVHGIAWADDGETMWTADTAAGTVSRIRPEDGRMYDVFRVEDPVEVHGMTIHEGVLWYADAESCDIGRLIVDMQPHF